VQQDQFSDATFVGKLLAGEAILKNEERDYNGEKRSS
jgi:hypothetical protein